MVKMLPRTKNPLVAQNAATKATPIKVCMHVTHVTNRDYRVMREATALVEAGFEVSIVDIIDDREQPVEEIIASVNMKHVLIPGLNVPTRFKPWFLVKAALMIIRSAIRLIHTPADVYHAHDEKGLPACYIAARWRRKPLIFDAHEIPFDDPNIARRHRLRALATHILARMLPRCATVITTSPLYAQEIRNQYHYPEVTLVRNFPTYRAVPKSDRLQQYLDLGPDVRIALYQGNLQPNRSLDQLVRAAPFLEPDIVIVMMGTAKETTRDQLEDLIVSEGVANRVKIIPPVPYEELLDWTASADIGLTIFQPDYTRSIRFCLPNKLFEYLMAGLPVLSSPLDAIAEVLKTYNVGQIVSSLAPADVAAAINIILADRAALARMRLNALEAAKHELCWEKESLQLISLYQKILCGS